MTGGITESKYSIVHGFWSLEDLAELADGPIGCDELVGEGVIWLEPQCNKATEVERRTRPNMRR